MTKSPFHGHEIKSLEGLGPRWDDLRFPAQNLRIPGTGTPPGTEAATGFLLFGASSTELVGGIAQMPHAWREGSTIKPHVHWQKTTSAAGNVLWRLDYEIVNNGAVAPMAYGSQIESASPVAGTPDNDTANEILITSLGDIAMSGISISGHLLWKLSRVGGDASDTYGADARLLEYDIHFQIDSRGSIEEFTKTDP